MTHATKVVDVIDRELRGKRMEFLKDVHQRVLKAVGTGRTLGREEMERLVDDAIEKTCATLEIPEAAHLTREEVKKQSRENILGYGPLDDLLRDDTLSDVLVNSFNEIYIEREGKLILSDKWFLDNSHLRNVIDRILRNIGRSVNDLSPYADGRLDDGSRINVVIPPIALDGPMMTIRKFPKNPITIKDLIERHESISADMADFLSLVVRNRRNIVISGGSGSGKTTLLNVISQFIPGDERIITIEDSAELKLHQPHLGRMETRQANYEGKGEVTIRDLVRNALRMRPDRIVVGECRGGEAIDMLQAMNTGHDGSITTVHANSPADVLYRLETMVTLAGFDLPLGAIRRQIASAVNLIIHVARLADGKRKVVRVSEVIGLKDSEIHLQDLFEFRKEIVTEAGEIKGIIRPCGNLPTFIDHVMPEERSVLKRIFTPVTENERAS